MTLRKQLKLLKAQEEYFDAMANMYTKLSHNSWVAQAQLIGEDPKTAWDSSKFSVLKDKVDDIIGDCTCEQEKYHFSDHARYCPKYVEENTQALSAN